MDLNTLIAPYLNRFHAVLDAFDAFLPDEDLEELNSELEDILFMIDCSDFVNDEEEYELFDALDEIEDLLDGYHLVAKRRLEIGPKVADLASVLRLLKCALQ